MGNIAVSWEVNAVTIIAFLVQFTAVIGYAVTTNLKAKSAYLLAEEARRDAREAHVQIGALQGQISLMSEKIAREHPDQSDIRGMEERLMTEIHRINDRLDQLIRTRRNNG